MVLNYWIFLTLWPSLIKFCFVDFVHTLTWVYHEIEFTHYVKIFCTQISIKFNLEVGQVWAQKPLVKSLLCFIDRLIDLQAIDCLMKSVVWLSTSAIVNHLNEDSTYILINCSMNVRFIRCNICKDLHLIWPDCIPTLLKVSCSKSSFFQGVCILLIVYILYSIDTEVVGQQECT